MVCMDRPVYLLEQGYRRVGLHGPPALHCAGGNRREEGRTGKGGKGRTGKGVEGSIDHKLKMVRCNKRIFLRDLSQKGIL